jgi:hypothetical protein
MESKVEGDFIFNGIPIYNIDLNDFLVISDAFITTKKLFTKNLNSQILIDRIRRFSGHSINIGVCFEGIIIDLREFKNIEK